MTKEKQIKMSEDLFSEVVMQVAILKEMYDKIEVNREMNILQRKALLKNKKLNKQVLDELEKMCD